MNNAVFVFDFFQFFCLKYMSRHSPALASDGRIKEHEKTLIILENEIP